MPYSPPPSFLIPDGGYATQGGGGSVGGQNFTYSQPSAPSLQNFSAPSFSMPQGGNFAAPGSAGNIFTRFSGGGIHSTQSPQYALGFAFGQAMAKRRRGMFGEPPPTPISMAGDRKMVPWQEGLQNPIAGRAIPY